MKKKDTDKDRKPVSVEGSFLLYTTEDGKGKIEV